MEIKRLGFLSDQAMLGTVDIVIGAFSKTFASNGGFAAYRSPTLKLALRSFANPLSFFSALSPIQAATLLAAIDIVRSVRRAVAAAADGQCAAPAQRAGGAGLHRARPA